MPKLTFNDLPAAIEALMLRVDILHDLVKSTKDTLDSLINDDNNQNEPEKMKSGQADITEEVPDSRANVTKGDERYDIGRAADFLGISNASLYMAVERRQISHFRQGNRIFFKLPDLDNFKNRHAKRSIRASSSTSLHDEPSIILGEENDKLLSMEEAVEHTGITKTNMYSFVKTKKIPFVKKGRRLFFPIVALNQLMIQSIERPSRRGRKKRPVVSETPQTDKQESDPDHVTLRQIVKMLGKHPSTIYYQLRKKNIPVVAKKGNRILYSLKEVQRALSDQSL